MMFLCFSRRHFAATFAAIAAFALSFCAFADPWDNWTRVQISTNSFHINHVVYGGGRYVAGGGAGDGGVLLSSEDGLNWTVRAQSGGANPSLVWGLTYARGRFIAVGLFGGIATSPDGINWAFTNVNSVGLYGVAWGLNFVAVGGGPGDPSNVFISADGVNWNPKMIQMGNKRPTSIAFGPGFKFVVTGFNSIFVSSDFGTNWTQASIPGIGGPVISGRGLFIVPWVPGTNLLSTNGNEWIPYNTGLTGALTGITLVNGLFVGRSGNFLAISTDGTNWAQRPYPSLPEERRIDAGSSATLFASDGKRLVTLGNSFIGADGVFHSDAYMYASDESAGLITLSGVIPPRLTIFGVAGAKYRFDYADELSAGSPVGWQSSPSFTLVNTPYSWTNSSATNAAHQFYRAVLLP